MPDTPTESRVLTTDDIDMIAERAARRALDLVLVEVGRSVVKKCFFLAGVVAIFILVFLKDGKSIG
jgi:hypothetical protein|tara:strand:- start:302 stop:499 length:198 start_codon:yes stop_codon:yes gene_type:complete